MRCTIKRTFNGAKVHMTRRLLQVECRRRGASYLGGAMYARVAVRSCRPPPMSTSAANAASGTLASAHMRPAPAPPGALCAVKALSAFDAVSTFRSHARASSVKARGSTAPRAASADAGTRRVPCSVTTDEGRSGMGAASLVDAATRATTVRAYSASRRASSSARASGVGRLNAGACRLYAMTRARGVYSVDSLAIPRGALGGWNSCRFKDAANLCLRLFLILRVTATRRPSTLRRRHRHRCRPHPRHPSLRHPRRPHSRRPRRHHCPRRQ